MKALTGSDRARSSDLLAVVQGVGKSFDECLTWSLRDITFGVRRGEVFGLVGSSGAGKTTLMKLLAGQLRPTEGKIKVFGRSPRRGAIKARVGYMPQMSANSQVGSGSVVDWFGNFFRRADGRQNHVAEKSLNKIHWRSELANTVFGKRDLIIFDAPFSNLDSSERDEMKSLIQTLARKGKAVLLSSNSLEDVLAICQRLAVLNGGRMEFVGAWDELMVARPAVRVLAPTLPDSISEELHSVIRQYLASAGHAGGASREPADEFPVNWKQAGAYTETSTGVPTGEKDQVPTQSELFKADSGGNSVENSVSITHDKLSKLLAPKVPEARPLSAPKTNESFDADAKANKKLSALVAKPK